MRTIFGFKLIRESEYTRLVNNEIRVRKVSECRRWFSGWEDLDIIWDYVLKTHGTPPVESIRNNYARARGTDEYGQPVKNSKIKVDEK